VECGRRLDQTFFRFSVFASFVSALRPLLTSPLYVSGCRWFAIYLDSFCTNFALPLFGFPLVRNPPKKNHVALSPYTLLIFPTPTRSRHLSTLVLTLWLYRPTVSLVSIINKTRSKGHVAEGVESKLSLPSLPSLSLPTDEETELLPPSDLPHPHQHRLKPVAPPSLFVHLSLSLSFVPPKQTVQTRKSRIIHPFPSSPPPPSFMYVSSSSSSD